MVQEIYLDKTESTNLYAKNNLMYLADKTIIYTRKQTSGHGRLKRSWVDLGGENLFLSFVLKPSNEFREVYSNLTQYLSVVLCKVLENYGVKPEIKWPNDVQVDGKKIAGILSESVVQGSNFKGIVLGVGVNINNDEQSLNLVTDKDITSLNIEINKNIDVDEFRNKLVDLFFDGYNEFLENGFEFIKQDYLNRACFLNKNINIRLFDEDKSGIATAVTDSGELVLKNNDKEFVLTIGDIL